MPAPEPPPIERLAPSRVTEVSALVKAADALEAWKAKHPEAAAELVELAGLYNPALKAAQKVLKLRLVSCGPIELYQFRRKDNAQVLLDAVGRQKFPSLGGVLKPVEELSIDRERFDLAVAQERVDAALVAKVVKFEPAFHAPDEIVLPGPAPDPGAAHLRSR